MLSSSAGNLGLLERARLLRLVQTGWEDELEDMFDDEDQLEDIFVNSVVTMKEEENVKCFETLGVEALGIHCNIRTSIQHEQNPHQRFRSVEALGHD